MAMVESAADSERPALVVDIDGVFNIWSKAAPEGCLPRPERMFRETTYYNPIHGEWIRHVHEALADIYYISDLRADAHTSMSQIHDWPKFDWIDIWPYHNRVKSDHALRAMAITALFGDRPVAWIDDIVTDLEFRWAKVRSNTQGAPTLVVKTELDAGLQPEQMTEVEGWLINAATGKLEKPGTEAEKAKVKK